MDYPSETPHLTSSRKRKGWNLALIVVLLLACLCAFLLLLGGYYLRDQIPFIAGLIATSTPSPTFTPNPECILYDEPALGIHFCYPNGWHVLHDAGTSGVAVSPIPDILDYPDFPENAVVVIFMRDEASLTVFTQEGFVIDSPEDLHNWLKSSMGEDSHEELEPFRLAEVAGYPGGRSLFLLKEQYAFNVVVGLNVSMSGEVPTFIISMVAESVWEENRPDTQAIIDSTVIDPVMP